jgi:hypothetical protein
MKILLMLGCFLSCYFSQVVSHEELLFPLSKSKNHIEIVPEVDEITHLPHKLKNFLTFTQRSQSIGFRPGYCELVYTPDNDLLYAYYAHSFSVTILAGYNKGLQAFYDYRGYLIDGSYDWAYVWTDEGLTMMHQYLDSVVYTSYYNQEVIFY